MKSKKNGTGQIMMHSTEHTKMDHFDFANLFFMSDLENKWN